MHVVPPQKPTQGPGISGLAPLAQPLVGSLRSEGPGASPVDSLTLAAPLLTSDPASSPTLSARSLGPGGSAQAQTVSSTSSPTQAGIPDVAGILASGKRYEDLNTAITGSYTHMAEGFQAIIDPTGQHQGAPNWFAIACYASRGAGQGMALGHRLASALATSTTSLGGLMRFALSPVPGPVAAVAAQAAAAHPTTPLDLAHAGQLMARVLQPKHDGKQHLSDHPEMLDPRMMAVMSSRLTHLLAQAPGATLHQKLSAVTGTLLHGLEDGNRMIFSDMGAAGASYLTFREAHGGKVTPEQVLREYASDGPPQPAVAQAIFERARTTAQGQAPLPTDLITEFPEAAADSRPMFTAAFALYEEAGRTTDARQRDRLVAYGNNLLAWREQHDTAAPAFDPGEVRSGEVKRMDIWQLMTPLVDIKSRSGVWRYSAYVKQHDEPGPYASLLAPPVTRCNWGHFEERWPAILNAFDDAYAHASALWPMPNPDPRCAIDDPVTA